MSELQAILFKKTAFTSAECRQWLKDNNHTPIKRVHITKNYRRYRLKEPVIGKKYRIIKLEKNISGVILFN
jgi:hypothetical protein